jgi:hypothetical protein
MRLVRKVGTDKRDIVPAHQKKHDREPLRSSDRIHRCVPLTQGNLQLASVATAFAAEAALLAADPRLRKNTLQRDRPIQGNQAGKQNSADCCRVNCN